jgi:hypothetical protein
VTQSRVSPRATRSWCLSCQTHSASLLPKPSSTAASHASILKLRQARGSRQRTRDFIRRLRFLGKAWSYQIPQHDPRGSERKWKVVVHIVIRPGTAELGRHMRTHFTDDQSEYDFCFGCLEQQSSLFSRNALAKARMLHSRHRERFERGAAFYFSWIRNNWTSCFRQPHN